MRCRFVCTVYSAMSRFLQPRLTMRCRDTEHRAHILPCLYGAVSLFHCVGTCTFVGGKGNSILSMLLHITLCPVHTYHTRRRFPTIILSRRGYGSLSLHVPGVLADFQHHRSLCLHSTAGGVPIGRLVCLCDAGCSGISDGLARKSTVRPYFRHSSSSSPICASGAWISA